MSTRNGAPPLALVPHLLSKTIGSILDRLHHVEAMQVADGLLLHAVFSRMPDLERALVELEGDVGAWNMRDSAPAKSATALAARKRVSEFVSDMREIRKLHKRWRPTSANDDGNDR